MNASETRFRPGFDPWPCVVLAIDPGATSGWAVFAPRRCEVFAFGTTRKGDWRGRADAVDAACSCADAYDLPLLVVREKWGARVGGRTDRGNAAVMMAGLGKAWGAWAEQIRIRRERATFPVLQLHPSTWWSRTLGGRRPKREIAEPRSIEWARRTLSLEPTTADEAAALCMGYVAQTHESVRALLPKSALADV